MVLFSFFAEGCKRRAKLAVFQEKSNLQYFGYKATPVQSGKMILFRYIYVPAYCFTVVRASLGSMTDVSCGPPGVDGGAGSPLGVQHTLLLPGARQRGGGGG